MTWVLLGLRFLGNFIKEHPWQVALLASLTLCWHLNGSRNSWREKTEHEVKAHRTTKEDYTRAQSDAIDLARKEKAEKEKEYETARVHAEKSHADLSAKYRTLVLRLQSGKTVGGSASNSDLPGSPEPTGSADRSYLDPVLLERDDVMICAVNQARIESIQKWWTEVAAKPQ